MDAQELVECGRPWGHHVNTAVHAARREQVPCTDDAGGVVDEDVLLDEAADGKIEAAAAHIMRREAFVPADGCSHCSSSDTFAVDSRRVARLGFRPSRYLIY
jgi:hypothetical protein